MRHLALGSLSVPANELRATRYGISLAPALLVTFALFWTMQGLVSASYEPVTAKPPVTVSIVRVIPDTTPLVKPPVKPPLAKPEPAQLPPPILTPSTQLERGDARVALERELDPGKALKDARQAGSDRGLVALVRPEPEYPATAQARGVGGWVRLEFTVTKVGGVRDVRVVASQPERLFDHAALAAVRRWRYNPRVSHGQAVDTPGVEVLLHFRP
jgi:protein TonB